MIMVAGIVLTVVVLMIGFLLLVEQKEERLNDKTKKNKKNKLPRTPETYEKVIKFICDRRRKKQKYGSHMIKKGKVNIMAGHIIDKDNTTKALQSVNRLLSQSLEVIKKVNEDEQWNFCTDDRLAHIVNDTERLTKEVSKIV